MYVRGYLQGSENGRVVTIETNMCQYVIIIDLFSMELYTCEQE